MSPADRIVWALGALSLIVSCLAIVAVLVTVVVERFERRRPTDVLPPPVRDVNRQSSSLIDVDFRQRRRLS
jgi:hypothetical protein